VKNNSRNENRPTLKTISNISGLAVATVSRALGDAPDISAKTKEKVRLIAKQIGYVPHRAGVRLRTGRTQLISVVISTETDLMNSRLISSISSGLRNSSYHLNIMHCFPDDNPMDPIRYIVETASADAVIINAIERDDPRVEYLVKQKFPFAMHGRTRINEVHPFYDYDNAAFARLGIEALHKKNRKRILVIPPPLNHFYSQEIIKGVNEATQGTAIELVIPEDISSENSINKITNYVTELIKLDASIDGLFAPTPNIAMAAIAGFESNGYKIGLDYDAVAKDTINFLKLFRKEIIVIDENVASAGAFLAKAAINAARNSDSIVMQHLDTPTTENLKY